MATLAEKLRVREGFSIALINPPPGYQDLLGGLPQGVTRSTSADGEFDWIQYFAVKRQQLEADVESLKRGLKDGAQLWVSYPKAKQMETDLSRDRLVDTAREHGLRPVAQISIDDVWSALRFKVVG